MKTPKNWKKISERKTALHWKRLFGKNEYGEDVTGVVAVDWQKLLDKPRFTFSSRYKNNKVKEFKTKEEALKFAIRYMKKH